MEINFVALLLAAVVTLATGFIWHHPKVFGTIWMRENNFTQEELQKGNMLKIFGLHLYFLFNDYNDLNGTYHSSIRSCWYGWRTTNAGKCKTFICRIYG